MKLLLYTLQKEELVENLSYQNITDLRRITVRKNYKIYRTNHIILTFSSSNLPTLIHSAYLRCLFRPYILNLQRCFRFSVVYMEKNPVMVALPVLVVQKLAATIKTVKMLKDVSDVKVFI